jgi:alkylation response protein AidB-like acyl-CoA dehydrogenase
MVEWPVCLQRPAPDTRSPAAAAAAVRQLLDAGAGDQPLPGRGATGHRWAALRAISRWDVVVGRLVEAHLDAAAILADLDPGGPGIAPGEWWAVWAAEPPGPGVTAYPASIPATPAMGMRLPQPDGAEPRVPGAPSDGGWALRGRKAWCSGAGLATHALITAATSDGRRRLFAASLANPGVHPVPGGWQSAGMAGSDTRMIDLVGVPARAIGAPGDYLTRPGFWHGAVGVAACWLGGADAVLDPLIHAALGGRLDTHALAHLGACEAALHAAGAELDEAAIQIDSDPADTLRQARLVALRARAVVERAATEVIDRVGRALGPGPLVQDAAHARHVADLQIYLRQSHAERDLATLGELTVEAYRHQIGGPDVVREAGGTAPGARGAGR